MGKIDLSIVLTNARAAVKLAKERINTDLDRSQRTESRCQKKETKHFRTYCWTRIGTNIHINSACNISLGKSV
jgi:hypothetical protein